MASLPSLGWVVQGVGRAEGWVVAGGGRRGRPSDQSSVSESPSKTLPALEAVGVEGGGGGAGGVLGVVGVGPSGGGGGGGGGRGRGVGVGGGGGGGSPERSELGERVAVEELAGLVDDGRGLGGLGVDHTSDE